MVGSPPPWPPLFLRHHLSLQLLGIILSCVFWNLLVDMSESPDMVDFKVLKRAGFEYGELDLAGAGWCLCLPRDGGYLPIPASEPELDPIDAHLQKLKKQPPRTHSQLRELQESRSATGLDEIDIGRKQKREHWMLFLIFLFLFCCCNRCICWRSCVALLNGWTNQSLDQGNSLN